MKSTGKTILAYLSIGEAEDYRDYWQNDWQSKHPDFIAEENPEWPGNYKVKYWDPEWQRIVLDRVRRIAELGYDGAYLDIIDAYEYWQERGVPDAAELMVEFVKKIAEEARQINPDFLIVPQNAPELYEFPEYRKIISGFGKEDTWYVDNSPQDPAETNQALYYLDQAVRDGKFVLAVDYPTNPEKICDF